MADVKLTRDDALKNFLTPNGKRVSIDPIRGTHHYQLKWEGGGEAPREFDSLYTSKIQAELAAKAFLQARWDAEEKKKVSKPVT